MLAESNNKIVGPRFFNFIFPILLVLFYKSIVGTHLKSTGISLTLENES